MTESDILISYIINMFNDSFNFKPFIINVILSSLKKVFKLFTLINIKIINITFINESLMLKLYKRFKI